MVRLFNILTLLLLVLLAPLGAQAQSAIFKIGTGESPMLLSRTGKPLVLGSQSTEGILIRINGATLEKYSSSPAVPTMAATPVVGTNEFYPGLNVVPTAAANTAAFLGPSTPIPNQRFLISNASGAAVRVKAAGGATLNGATAGGWISVASLATVECFTQSATNQVCMQPVIPTPQ